MNRYVRVPEARATAAITRMASAAAGPPEPANTSCARVVAPSSRTEIGVDHATIGGQLGGRPGERDLTGVDHVGAVRDPQGGPGVLLHQQDGGTRLVDR